MVTSRFVNPFRRFKKSSRLVDESLPGSTKANHFPELIPEPNIGDLDKADFSPLKVNSGFARNLRSQGAWEAKPEVQPLVSRTPSSNNIQTLPALNRLNVPAKNKTSEILPFKERINDNDIDYDAFRDFNSLTDRQKALNNLISKATSRDKNLSIKAKQRAFNLLNDNAYNSQFLEKNKNDKAARDEFLQIERDQELQQRKNKQELGVSKLSNLLSKSNGLRQGFDNINDRALKKEGASRLEQLLSNARNRATGNAFNDLRDIQGIARKFDNPMTPMMADNQDTKPNLNLRRLLNQRQEALRPSINDQRMNTISKPFYDNPMTAMISDDQDTKPNLNLSDLLNKRQELSEPNFINRISEKAKTYEPASTIDRDILGHENMRLGDVFNFINSKNEEKSLIPYKTVRHGLPIIISQEFINKLRNASEPKKQPQIIQEPYDKYKGYTKAQLMLMQQQAFKNMAAWQMHDITRFNQYRAEAEELNDVIRKLW